MNEKENNQELEELEVLEENELIEDEEQHEELEEFEEIEQDEEFEQECEEEIEEEYAEEYVEEEQYEEYYESKKPIGKLITLVAFTAIMLVSSTYAWFSTQKNVTISGIEGKVEVAENLQISLNALNWTNEIDLSDEGVAAYFAQANSGANTDYDLENPYEGRTNILPSELKPVSTTAQSGEGIGLTRLNMYEGINSDEVKLSNIRLLDEVPASGYYAIDFFLQNVSAEDATVEDLLKINTNSNVSLLSADKYTTGLQNAVRVAFALFNNDGTTKIKVNKYPTQAQILEGTENQTIKDVAIWEPNATGSTAHVQYIIDNNNDVTWSVDDASKYFNRTITTPEIIRFDGDDLIPTYALTATSKTAKYTVTNGATSEEVTGIQNIYDWANNTSTTGLTKQHTLGTSTAGVAQPAQLVSVSNGTTNFSIAPGEYHKVRMYVWLEGQDVDCINHASLGGGIRLEVGLTKETDEETEPTAGGPYLPSGFSWANAAHTEIEDPSHNLYVWVSVPRDETVYNDMDDDTEDTGMSDTTNEDILAFNVNSLTADNLKAIETELKEYTATYRNGTSYKDEFYSGNPLGFADATAYNNHKNAMLTSVFKNEGFYVGKYETGIADNDPDPDVVEARTAEGDATQTPVIQANAYPYNYVTCAQAQELAKTKFNGGGYTTSLMFGLQWDLVLKHLEVTEVASESELKSNSTLWGNYKNNTTTNVTNTSAKYAEETAYTWTDGAYGKKSTSKSVVLSTGASDDFERGGIYDLAGNVYEWTLEYTSITGVPCAYRGGGYNNDGSNHPASDRYHFDTSSAYRYNGFRVSLF